MNVSKAVLRLIAGTEAAFFAGSEWLCLKGQHWIVTGPNGSGKSLLAALLADRAVVPGVMLTVPREIEGRVESVSFEHQQAQASRGWLQSRWHWDEDPNAASVESFLSYEAVNHINPYEIREPEPEARKRHAETRRKVDQLLLTDALSGKMVLQLSNGEMRRLLLARALLRTPRVLVLDDPFAGLDVEMRHSLKQGLQGMVNEGVTLIMMVRHPDEVPTFATHHLTLGKKGAMSSEAIVSEPELENSADGFKAIGGQMALSEVIGGFKYKSGETSVADPVVELSKININLGGRVLFDDFSWTVRRGERWLLKGPNGSGKTTLLSLISGDNPTAYSQDVRVFGSARKSGEQLWRLRHRIGQVSPEQQAYFDPRSRVGDIVLSGLFDADGEPLEITEQLRTKAKRWLETFGLTDRTRDPLGSLAAGHQRLALLARAMVSKAELLLLDEPCFNLDNAGRGVFLQALYDFLSEHPITVIYVAHRDDDVPPGFELVMRL